MSDLLGTFALVAGFAIGGALVIDTHDIITFSRPDQHGCVTHYVTDNPLVGETVDRVAVVCPPRDSRLVAA